MALNKSVLDRLFHDLFNGSHDMFGQIVEMFLTETPSSLRELAEKFEQGDVRSVMHLAHTLKSNGASLGAVKFRDLCARIEAAGRAGAIPDFQDWYRELVAEFQVCSEELQKSVHELAA